MPVSAEELIARVRENPDDPGAFADLRAYYLRVGDHASLANLLEGWAGRTQDHGAAANAFVQAANLIARYDSDVPRAITVYERALERQPTNAEATARLEELFQHTGEARRLIDLYERRIKALTRLQGDRRVIAELHEKAAGAWLKHFQRSDKSVAGYRTAFELDPTRVSAIYAAREIYKQSGNLEAAIPLYQLEANAEPDAGRRVGLLRELASIRHQQLRDLTGAIASLQEALRIAPQDPNVLLELATLRLEHAAADGPDAGAERREAADLLLQLAPKCGKNHALAYAAAALDAAPDFEPALVYLEDLATELNRRDVLPTRWMHFIAAAPDGPSVRRRRQELATAYVEAGQPADAILCLEPLLQLGDVDAAQALVSLYREAGRHPDAERALSIAKGALPADERLPRLQERMQLLMAKGDLPEATATAKELLGLDPNNVEALRLLKQTSPPTGVPPVKATKATLGSLANTIRARKSLPPRVAEPPLEATSEDTRRVAFAPQGPDVLPTSRTTTADAVTRTGVRAADVDAKKRAVLLQAAPPAADASTPRGASSVPEDDDDQDDAEDVSSGEFDVVDLGDEEGR